MRLRVLLEEADALIDVLRVPVDGRHRDGVMHYLALQLDLDSR